MKRIQIVGLTALAVAALGAMTATSAFGVEWLLNGASITTATASTTDGSFMLEDTKAGAGIIKCSFHLVGTSGAGTADSVTQVWSLLGTAPPITCSDTSCSPSSVQVIPVLLPWTTKVGLDGTTYVDSYIAAGFEATCTILGIKVTDKCEGNMGASLTNVTGGVEGVFGKNEEINPALTCSIGGAKTGLVTGSYITKAASGTLGVS